MKPIALLSLGGSLVVPDKIDVGYLKKFASFINRNLKRWRFVIVVGGGKTTRKYQEAARKLGVKKRADLDWVGIYSSRLNKELLRALFGQKAEADCAYYPGGIIRFKKPILLGAGSKPGWSTDFVAAGLAVSYKLRRIINLTNINYVFDRDPKKFKSAKPIRQVSWRKFRRLVGDAWTPGLHKPFDPIASKLAQKHRLEVIILNGGNLHNLQKALNGRKFIGTVVR